VASHPETRILFLQGLINRFISIFLISYYASFSYIKAHIPIFLYPFLHTTSSKTRPFEYLRLTSLGVIGALVKVGEICFYINLLNIIYKKLN